MLFRSVSQSRYQLFYSNQHQVRKLLANAQGFQKGLLKCLILELDKADMRDLLRWFVPGWAGVRLDEYGNDDIEQAVVQG